VSLLRKLLYPFSILYGEITSARNIFYNKGILKSTVFNIPIIVVGNLSVGGTGKTPQVEYLTRLLQDKYKVAILSRGYKRSTKGFVIANKTTNAKAIGDEPMQYYTKFNNIIVAVDADRVHGITALSKLADKPDVILLDDAYQHRKVEAGLNVLLTSYGNLYIDDTMLPTGNLREKVNGAERAQIIIVTKCPEELSENEQFEITKKLKAELYQTVFFSTIKYGKEIIGKENRLSIDELLNYEIVLVTGIANTEPLVTFLNKIKCSFEHLNFADHYNFTENDLQKIKSTCSKIKATNPEALSLILTTEKDYVRSFTGIDNFYYLPIETGFIAHQEDFNKLIKKYVDLSCL
jgi:tetraacyldisaccharide 4'-kinase